MYDHYYKHSQALFERLALWPYQQSTWYRQWQRIFIIAIFICGIIVQLNTFVTSECTFELFVKIVPFAMITLNFTVKYISYYVNMNKQKIILDRIRYEWNTLKNEKELEILRSNADIARYLTIIFACFVYIGSSVTVFGQFLPVVLNIVVPLNESRPYKSHFHTEYFIDEQKYVYVPLVHTSVILIVGSNCVVATEGISMSLIYHYCGLLQIVSYRIKGALNEDFLRSSSVGKRECYRIHERIVDIVYGHRRVFESVSDWSLNYALSAFDASYLILLFMGVTTLAINLFHVRQAILLMDDIEELMTAVLHSCIIVIYIFFFCYLGQEILDRSCILFENLYDTHWYQAPISTQKLVLIIMNRTMVNKGLVLCRVFTASYENFASIMQTSVSYFMFICSTL